MQLVLVNISGTPLSYLGGIVVVPAFGSYNVPTNLIFDVSEDPNVRADINVNLLQISDSVTNYGNVDASNFLNRLIGLKDKNGIGISSTTITSKTGIDVNVINPVDVGANYTNRTIYNEVTSLSSGVEFTIVSYTASATNRNTILSVLCSGDNIATYSVCVNSNVISKKRTYFGGDLNTDFVFIGDGTSLNFGDVVEIKVIHNRPSLSYFNATIIIKEEN